MPLYEYQCSTCEFVTEAMHPIAERDTAETCPNCGGKASLIMSAPRFVLEGCTGDFPTAHDQWWKKRRQKLNQERKANDKPPLGSS